ncbi:RraA family protein [Roseomonas elaeocarpi]|uniref:Putative 4-hydroxy-4-methyl-2-oxoglutarate aldolase n=1 Tax=Roseomonas elaeocarpi TaxID=907779 RepID=A0ABV6JZB2_9PROT
MNLGFRIKANMERVNPSLVSRAAALPVANIGDVAFRMQAMRGGFRGYGGRRTVAGPALTVRARAGDNLMLHRALDLAEPGDVVVCDGGGELGIALMGDIMARHAVSRGIAAIIVDGAVRDIAELQQLDLGVWARGATPAGPFKEGPGEVGYPTSCGGIVVMPGDLVAADGDGIVVIPRADAGTIVAAAERHAEKEARSIAAIAEGRAERGWVEDTLRSKGCPTCAS